MTGFSHCDSRCRPDRQNGPTSRGGWTVSRNCGVKNKRPCYSKAEDILTGQLADIWAFIFQQVSSAANTTGNISDKRGVAGSGTVGTGQI